LELTVLLPTLDEGAHLAQVLADVSAAASRLTGSFEVLVVDGGSRDQTVAVASGAGARVLRQRGRGYGQAIREGLDAARGQWILAMDADGSHPVRYFEELWTRREGCDLVIASRFVPGGGGRMLWYRYALSWLLNLVTRRWLDWPIRDSSSGLRLYRRAAAAGLPLAAEDFSVQQEVLALILEKGGRVAETPFFYESRLSGESKADVLLLARRYLGMLSRLRRLRGGWAGPQALAGVLALGLATGLWGITWGLPGPARLRAFPDSLRPTPEVAQKFADAWSRLYEDIRRSHRDMSSEEPVTYVKGVEEIAPGWEFPPGKLLNSYRSLLLQSENPDEKKSFIILSQMRPWKLDFEPLYVSYGGAFIYPLGAFLGALSLGGAVHLTHDLRPYLLHPEEMGRLYLCGRLFILVFHLASLWVLYDMGRRLSGRGAGFFAAAFFSLCPLIVVNSHILKPHPYATFWCLAAARYALKAAEGGFRRDYLLGGACCGAAAGANLTFTGFAVMVPLAWLWRRASQRTQAREGLWVAGALALAVGLCVCANPYLLARFGDYAWEMRYAHQGHGWSLSSAAAVLGKLASDGMGPGLLLASVFGLLLAFFRGPQAWRFMGLLFIVTGFILWAFLNQFAGGFSGFARYYYPMVGLACLLAANFAMNAPMPRALRWIALLAVLSDAGLRTFVYLENMSLDCGPNATARAAADWIDAHVPSGASVGLTRYPEPAHTPPFRYDRYRLVVFETPQLLAETRLPDYLVFDSEAVSAMDKWVKNRYDAAQIFLPGRTGWARLQDESFFANAPFFAYKRKTDRPRLGL